MSADNREMLQAWPCSAASEASTARQQLFPQLPSVDGEASVVRSVADVWVGETASEVLAGLLGSTTREADAERRIATRGVTSGPTLSDGVFRYRTTVPAKVIDIHGHANNVAYVRWMQDVAIRHSEFLGMPWEWYAAKGAGFVVRRQAIEYLRPLREGDEIEIATWVPSISQSSSTRKTEITNAAGDAVLEAETTWIFVSLETGRPTRIPREVRAAFERKS